MCCPSFAHWFRLGRFSPHQLTGGACSIRRFNLCQCFYFPVALSALPQTLALSFSVFPRFSVKASVCCWESSSLRCSTHMVGILGLWLRGCVTPRVSSEMRDPPYRDSTCCHGTVLEVVQISYLVLYNFMWSPFGRASSCSYCWVITRASSSWKFYRPAIRWPVIKPIFTLQQQFQRSHGAIISKITSVLILVHFQLAQVIVRPGRNYFLTEIGVINWRVVKL